MIESKLCIITYLVLIQNTNIFFYHQIWWSDIWRLDIFHAYHLWCYFDIWIFGPRRLIQFVWVTIGKYGIHLVNLQLDYVTLLLRRPTSSLRICSNQAFNRTIFYKSKDWFYQPISSNKPSTIRYFEF